MPEVNGQKFPYTREGKERAQAARAIAKSKAKKKVLPYKATDKTMPSNKKTMGY